MVERDMTCPACTESHLRVSHLFYGTCKGCAARAVVRGRNFRRCQKEGLQDRWYRRECEQMGVTHDEVLAEAQLDFLNRRESATT
jgi:hypothetical protein